jgi:hypothetical protein
MNPISPIASRPPVIPVQAPSPVSIDRTRRSRSEVVASLPPFWRQLHERLAAAPNDEAKFRLLTQLAERSDEIPDCGPYLPEAATLEISEENLCEWTRDKPAKARGRLGQLLLGGNLIPSWPLYALQYFGRFDPWWDDKMFTAAKRYVALLRADREVVARLQTLTTLDTPSRAMLVRRMAHHASTSLDIAPPVTEALDKDQDGRDADMLAQTPVRIRFYPTAFAKGSLNLIVTVFHEAVHAEQVGTVQHAREAESGTSSALSPEKRYRGEVLELSIAHLDAIAANRRNDYYYYLYRYATESEREAHAAELVVALFATACPELLPSKPGVLADIGATIEADRGRGAGGTDALVRTYIKKRTGFDMSVMCQLLEKTLAASHRRWPALHELMVRGRSTQVAHPRAFARLRFETTADRLAGRTAMPRVAANRRAAVNAAPGRSASALEHRDAGDDPSIETAWNTLLQLQQLRDASDRSGLLVQALMAESPKLFYAPSSEARFLRLAIATALDANRPSLIQVLRRHLERRFGCKLVRNPSPMQFAAAAKALQSAWYTYCSDLSRKIVFEVACETMGFSAAPDEIADSKMHKRRNALKRTLAGAPAALPNVDAAMRV